MLPELLFPDRNYYRVPYEIAVESKEESQVNSTRTQYLRYLGGKNDLVTLA